MEGEGGEGGKGCEHTYAVGVEFVDGFVFEGGADVRGDVD